jgi:enoyl-CoA hydratase/carnithine racemase
MAKRVTLDFPREGVACVRVCHPEIQNHGSWELVDQLADSLAQAREQGARVVVLASGVEGHWIEHAWLADLHAMLTGGETSGNGSGWFRALDELARTPVVSIAAITGDCSGGGAEIGWACDLRIAESQARFGQPEVQIGVATGVGGTCRVSRLIGRTATAELVLDGTPFTAQRLYELGGVNRVVPTGTGLEVALAWADRLADRPPEALATLKQMLIDGDDRHLDEALAQEQRRFQELVTQPAAKSRMRAVQGRIEAGESLRELYGPPRE